LVLLSDGLAYPHGPRDGKLWKAGLPALKGCGLPWWPDSKPRHPGDVQVPASGTESVPANLISVVTVSPACERVRQFGQDVASSRTNRGVHSGTRQPTMARWLLMSQTGWAVTRSPHRNSRICWDAPGQVNVRPGLLQKSTAHWIRRGAVTIEDR